jgi:hypothetical protein
VVPIPTFPPLDIVRYVDVEFRASEEVPIRKVPSTAESNQCLALVKAFESEIAKYGVEEAICNDQNGDDVPIPTFPVASTLNLSVGTKVPDFATSV